MTTPENERSAEVYKTPEITLVEHEDFIDSVELYDRIANELISLGKDPAETLLCGYAEQTEDDTRTTTYARAFNTVVERLEYPTEWDPYRYAADETYGTGGKGVISVYDANGLTAVLPEVYTSRDDAPIAKHRILKVLLDLQS